MKIVILGGAGFIGSNMLAKLYREKQDCTFYVIDNLYTGKLKNIQEYLDKPNVKFIEADIREENIISILQEINAEYIYNFACPASPVHYQATPIMTWETSILGVRNLLRAIVGTKTVLLHSSTSEVYGDCLVNPQVESYWGNVNPIGIRSCYDEGKRAAESLIYDYIRAYGVDVRVVRIFNTYGPNMSVEDGRIISNFVVQALQNKDITIYGTGKQTRSFCFVEDTLEGMVRLTENKERIDMPVNVGNPNERSVLDVAEYVIKAIPTKSKIIFLEKVSDDPQQRRPDITRAKQVLGWEPQVSFEEGLDKTIAYFKKELNV